MPNVIKPSVSKEVGRQIGQSKFPRIRTHAELGANCSLTI